MAGIPVSAQPQAVRLWMDTIESTFAQNSELVSYAQVVSTLTQQSILQNMQWFGGAAAPTTSIPGNNVAYFVKQYRDYAKFTGSQLIPEVENFFLLKFPNALLALFLAASQFGELYSGIQLLSGQFTDSPIIPPLVTIPSSFITDTVPKGIGSSFTQPAATFKNTLTASSTAPSVQGAWLKNYFTFNNSQAAGASYPNSPAFLDNTIQVVFGVFDPTGNVDGVYFTDSTNKSSKPLRYSLKQFSALTPTGSSTAALPHVIQAIDPQLAFYIGKDKTGYMSIHINNTFNTGAHSTTHTASTSISAVPLGLVFAKAEFVTALNEA
ncbi:MAG: hypothetical protein QXL94_00085 [Candidatus Parvarchaeum sp.]